MSRSACPITLRPATPGDRFLIRRWLGEPEVEAAWGNRASAEAEIALAMESPSALCRVIESGGEAIGYGHAVDAGVWGDPLPPELPAGCWDVDLFVASAAHREGDCERQALRELSDEVFGTTLAVACCHFVSVRNEGAVRASERAGFRWLRIWQDPIFGPCWVLLKDRPR